VTTDRVSSRPAPPDPGLGARRARRSAPLVAAIVIDAACWTVASALAWVAVGAPRGDGTPSTLLAVLLLAGAAHGVVGVASGLYLGRWLRGSRGEAKALLLVVTVAGLVALSPAVPALAPGAGPGVLRHWVLAAATAPLALILLVAVRQVRHVQRPDDRGRPERARALLLGAGDVAEHLVPQLLLDPASPVQPVGILDDDPARRRLRVHGVPVLGTLDDLAQAVANTGADTVVVTVARADSALLREVDARASAAGVHVLVLPPLDEVLRRGPRAGDLRDLSLDDLVGRRPVEIDLHASAAYLRGRRVLVTGAGGSIGSELCRQIAGFRPAELIMLDRDETALQAVQVSIDGHGLLDTSDVVLADIRDPQALLAVFGARRPDVVFHAAALKHLPMLEQYPLEAWQTNVMGTLNVLDACEASGVTTVVNVSTDKAAAPTSVLGRSKRVAERLTADRAARTGQRYLSVRFGNVFGSRGSLVPLFRSLLEAGHPLTVTHPDATRYFMSIPEACQLVLQAGAIGAPGEALVLDMGEPVKILDIAHRMIERSGRRDVDVVFTGLRPGEKLHEELTAPDERAHRPVHPLISHTAVPPLSPCDLDPDSVRGDTTAGRDHTGAVGH